MMGQTSFVSDEASSLTLISCIGLILPSRLLRKLAASARLFPSVVVRMVLSSRSKACLVPISLQEVLTFMVVMSLSLSKVWRKLCRPSSISVVLRRRSDKGSMVTNQKQNDNSGIITSRVPATRRCISTEGMKHIFLIQVIMMCALRA